jgi:hypothetical protein
MAQRGSVLEALLGRRIETSYCYAHFILVKAPHPDVVYGRWYAC